MQTRRSSKRLKDNEPLPEPEKPAVTQEAVSKVSPEDCEQIRQRAHEIADSLHAAANVLKQAVYDNPDAFFELLQFAKAPFAIVSLSDRVLTGLYNPSQGVAVGPIPVATFEEIIAAEMAPMDVDGMVPCDQPLLHLAPCDTSGGLQGVEEDMNGIEEHDYELGDEATARGSQDAIDFAEDDEGRELNTASFCPNAQEKNDTSSKRGRTPKVDDMVAYAVLMKVIHDPELHLEAAATMVTTKWEQKETQRSGGRGLQKKKKRVLAISTLRKRLPVVAGYVWTQLKNEEIKEEVVNKIQEAFPAVYREYMSSVEGINDTNQSNGEWVSTTEDAGRNNRRHSRRPRRQSRQRLHHPHSAIQEGDGYREEEEEQADTAYGDAVTIKKEKTLPNSTFQQEEQQAIEDEKKIFKPNWHANDVEEAGEVLLPIKQEPSQGDDHGLYYGLYYTGCASYDELMMNSSPSPQFDNSGGGGNADVLNGSPGFCYANGFVETPLYPKRRQQETMQQC